MCVCVYVCVKRPGLGRLQQRVLRGAGNLCDGRGVKAARVFPWTVPCII